VYLDNFWDQPGDCSQSSSWQGLTEMNTSPFMFLFLVFFFDNFYFKSLNVFVLKAVKDVFMFRIILSLINEVICAESRI
jgi:hypothetical protein